MDLAPSNRAPLVAPFTKENVNYARLCRLLIDCGTKALRITFEGFFTPASLQGFLARPSVYTSLKGLYKKGPGVLHNLHWSRLYPTPPSSPSLEDFDITLLMVLLRNTCGLTPPATGWDSLPSPSDKSLEANIVRVKHYRNWVYGHATGASVDDPTFNALWQDISSTLMRLGVDAHTIDELRRESVDPETKQYYEELLAEYRKEEDTIRNKVTAMENEFKELKDEVNEAITKMLATGASLIKGAAPVDLEHMKKELEIVNEKLEVAKLRISTSKDGGATQEDLERLERAMEKLNEKLEIVKTSTVGNEGQIKQGDNIWEKGECIGAGMFGKVYCVTLRATGEKLAAKEVQIDLKIPETKKQVADLRNEINILSNLKHKRIVSFHGSIEQGCHLYLFMDFMAKGSLYHCIKKIGTLDENICRKYTRQILEGLDYLHSEEIVHRDVKGANVLMTNDGDVKLTDFGISRNIQDIGSNLTSCAGTPYWMAPEVIIEELTHGRKVDIWSTGCTVVEMLTGSPPLKELDRMVAMFRISKNLVEFKLPEGVSRDAHDFVKAALTWDPDKRPRASELLEHPFVTIIADHGNEASTE